MLDGLAGQGGDRHAATLRLVSQQGVEVVWELDRGPLHVCQHTSHGSIATLQG
jgi:hypothetical protein